MKIMEGKKKLFNIVMIILFISIGFNMYYGSKERTELLNNKNTLYTIGKITNFNYGAKSPPRFTFYFYLDNNAIKGKYSINDTLRSKSGSYLKRKYIDKKFFVKYSVKKPKINELLLDKPVPDSLLDCVKCTWEELPF